jgi:hypothetical protein
MKINKPITDVEYILREALIKSFDKLRMNGNILIPFVVSLSNHERNQFVQHFLSDNDSIVSNTVPTGITTQSTEPSSSHAHR